MLPVPTSVRLPLKLKRWLERQALNEFTHVSRIVVREMTRYMKRHQKRHKEEADVAGTSTNNSRMERPDG